MNPGKKEKNQQIQVFVRVRPLNKQEGSVNVIDIRNAKELTIKHHATARSYAFDRVFGPQSRQIDVYKMVAEPTVAEVIAGYNCTVLAYGQTGTGKTYTMAGGTITDMMGTPESKSLWFEDVHSGIIPRTLAHMFDELRMQQLEYTVRVSYLELYNEEIFDLLSPVEDNSKLKLYDDSLKKGSVIVQGLTETTVNTKAEVYRILEKGAEKRRIASTLMNSQSSRSHTVFCITVHTKENSVDGEDLLKTGKLYLVDLAGSENIKQSGATDIRAREAFSINQSLLTLGRCIVKLMERSAHIPYRESKLTRLLQDSLGGRTKTTLIATVSPAFCNIDETLNTLDYANRAKHITNKPEINQRLSKKALLKEYTEEIERLRKDLLAARMGKGIYLDKDNYDTLLRERDIQRDEIAEKIGMIRVLQEEMDRKEQTCVTLKMSLEEHKKVVEEKVEVINTLENKLEEVAKEVEGLQEQNEIKQYIVEKHCETENVLKVTAKKLLTVADVTTADSEKLHDKLETLAEINKQNRSVCEEYISDFNSKINSMQNHLRNFQHTEFDFHKDILSSVGLIQEKSGLYFENTSLMCDHLHLPSKGFDDASNEFKRDFSELIGKVNIAQGTVRSNLEAGREQLNTIVQVDLHPKVETVMKRYLELHSYCKDFIQLTKVLVDTNIEKINKFTEFMNEAILDVQDSVSKEFERLKLNASQLVRDVQDTKRDQMAQSEAFNQKFDKAIANLIELKNITSLGMTNSLNRIETIASDASALSTELNCGMEPIKEIVDSSISRMNSRVNEMTECYTEVLSQMDMKENMADTHNRDTAIEHQTFGDAVMEIERYIQTSYEGINDVCLEVLQDASEEITNTRSSHEAILRKIESEATEFKHQITFQTHEFCTEVNEAMRTIDRDAKENEGFCSNHESFLTTELDKCREEFKKLFTTHYKEYKQTGVTPVRKRFRYPRTVVETKPHEELIEEFQKTRSSSASRVTDVENILDWQPGLTVRSSSDNNLVKTCTYEFDGNRTDPNIELRKKVDKDYHQPHPGEVITASKSNIPIKY